MMAIRDKHVFKFTGKEISVAATKEAEHYRAGISYREDEYNTLIDNFREKGGKVLIHEDAKDLRDKIEVVGDENLTNDIDECLSKKDSYRANVVRFEMQAVAYGSQGNLLYDLDSTDVIYFRLAGPSRKQWAS